MTESLNPPLRRRRRGIPLAALGLAALAVLGACGSDSKSSSDTTAKTDTASTAAGTTSAAATTEAPTTASSEPVTLRLGYFPNITHATGHRRRRARASSRSTLGAERHARDRRPSTPARRPSRRCSPAPSTPPTSARTRPSTPSPSPTARPSGSSPAPPRAAPSSSSSRTSTAPADLKGKKLATPQLGNTQDVALRYLAEGAGPDRPTTDGRRRRQHRPAGERQTLARRSTPATSTAPGCPSRGPPGWSRRAAARCSSTSATCGRTASSSPPT